MGAGAFPYSSSLFAFMGSGGLFDGGTFQILNLQSGTFPGRVRGEDLDEKLTLSADGRYFAAFARGPNEVRLFSLGASSKPQAVSVGDGLEFLAFAGSSRLVAETDGGQIIAWPIPAGRPEVRIPREKEADHLPGTGLSHGGLYVARPIGFGFAKRVSVFDLNTGKKVGDFDPPASIHTVIRIPTAFSLEGTRLGALFDKELVVWDLSSGMMLHSFSISNLEGPASGPTSAVVELQWFPGSKQLLVNGHSVVSLETKSVIYTVSAKPGTNVVVKVLPNGQLAILEIAFGPGGFKLSTVDVAQ